MIERIGSVQRIEYNTTKILPIRPYSKEEQKQIIAEINRLAEECAIPKVKLNDISNSSNFENMLKMAMTSIQLESEQNSSISNETSFMDNQNLVEVIKKRMIQQQNILDCWISYTDFAFV